MLKPAVLFYKVSVEKMVAKAFCMISVFLVTYCLSKDAESSELVPNFKSVNNFFNNSNNTSTISCQKNGSFSCSPGSYCNQSDGKCMCYGGNADTFICDLQEKRNFILDCYCLTFNEKLNKAEVGLCLYNCLYWDKSNSDRDFTYTPLPNETTDLNDFICGPFNRTGTLCGKCIDNTYILSYSYDMSCFDCNGNSSDWIKYILITYVPVSLFYVIVLIFQINIPLSKIQGYVFFCQVLSSPIIGRMLAVYFKGDSHSVIVNLVKVFGSQFAVWNLDLFRSLGFKICFRVSPLTVLSLNIFVAVYPLLLMMVTYILTTAHDNNFGPVVMVLKPFKALFSLYRSNWDVKTSTVGAFATYMFLSYIKFMNICFDLLFPVKICDISSSHSCRYAVFNEASIPYFGREHLPYALPAIGILFVFVLLPVVILLVYPFALCQNCLVFLPLRWRLILQVFVDSFQGCYKDGTDPGTRDCRWFSAMPFLVHLIMYVTFSSIILMPSVIYNVIVLVLTAMIIVIVDPYKPQFKDLSNSFVIFMLFLAILCVGVDYNSQLLSYLNAFLMAFLQLLYTTVVIVRWIIRHRKFRLDFICFRRNIM